MLRSIAVVLVLGLLLACPLPATARVVTDEIGRRIEVPDNPQRIIGLTPSLTEVLFALGLEDKIVGATTWADYPPAAKKLPRVGAYVNLNLEKIVALAPDLVIANKEGNPPWAVYKLAGLSIPVYVTEPSDPMTLPTSLEKLADVCGAPEAGKKLAAKIRAEFAEVAKRLKGVKPRRTLAVIGSRPLVAVGKDTMNHAMVELAGGINVAAAASQRWPRLNLEYVVAVKPEVIVVSTMDRGQDLQRELKYWRTLPGVGDQPGVRVEWMSSDLMDRPGPRIGQGLKWLARLIHPERFQDSEAKKP